jgi:hypothetical protein
MDYLAYVSILVTGLSAILAALLNSEIDQQDPEKRNAVFRRPTSVGWFLIVLMVVSSCVAAGIEKSNQEEKEHTKARLLIIQASLDEAHGDSIQKGHDLEQANESLIDTKAKLDLQSKFSEQQALIASDRARLQSEDITDAREQLNAEQRRATEEIKQQQQASQAEISAQQELIEASLLGQQTASPRVVLILPTSYPPSKEEKVRLSNTFADGGLVISYVLGERLANIKSDSVAEMDAEFASLEPRIANPIRQTVEFGWRASLKVTKDLEVLEISSGGGPHELIGRKPRLTLGYSTEKGRMYLRLESSLRKPVSSELLFAGKRQGEEVATLRVSVQGLDEEAIQLAEERMRSFFTEGEEWTLINDSSGMCAVAKIARPTVQLDGPSGNIKIAWHIDENNRLNLCPKGLFLADEAEEALDGFDPSQK